jgi:hypothetical protein
MLLRAELKKIAGARLNDAEALLLARRYDGAAYLCGYTIEIGLKLRICKTLKWEGFPETTKEFEGLQSFKSHSLNTLLKLSGVEEKIKLNYLAEWSIVKQWNPESRYHRVGGITASDAAGFVEACKVLLHAL